MISIDIINIITIIITALATSISAIVALRNLTNERYKNRMTYLKEVIDIVEKRDGPRYSESRQYLFDSRKTFFKEIEEVKRIVEWNDGSTKGFRLYGEYVLSIINKKIDKDENGQPLDDEIINRLRISYNKIKYFCESMDKLGSILNKKKDFFVLNHYKETISESFSILSSVGLIDHNDYPNYTELYKTVTAK